VRRIRIIPVLLIQKGGLVKSVRFKDHKYVGDPINAVKIFNEKEVDEIVILDIDATRQSRPPDLDQIREIAGEAFMPMAYGGGVSSLEQIKNVLFAGIEKVVINSAAIDHPELIRRAARQFGNQSIIASIDVKKNWLGKYQVMGKGGRQKTKFPPLDWARKMEDMGAGEIFLNSIDRDGTFKGYDQELIGEIAGQINIPLIACGGAGSVDDFLPVVKRSGASAAAAGSLFVFHGPHRAVLISYPDQDTLKTKIFQHL
jgi:cyclase